VAPAVAVAVDDADLIEEGLGLLRIVRRVGVAPGLKQLTTALSTRVLNGLAAQSAGRDLTQAKVDLPVDPLTIDGVGKRLAELGILIDRLLFRIGMVMVGI